MSAKKRTGRPSQFKSEVQRKRAAKQRNHEYQTSPEYKERRKSRYATDPEYRAACQQRAREYADSLKTGSIASYRATMTRKLNKMESFGSVRPVTQGNKTRQQICFSIAEMAEVLGRHHLVMRGWIRTGRFPEPLLTAKTLKGQKVKVYTLKQATALAKAAMNHLRTDTAHLSAGKVDALAALFRALM